MIILKNKLKYYANDSEKRVEHSRVGNEKRLEHSCGWSWVLGFDQSEYKQRARVHRHIQTQT